MPQVQGVLGPIDADELGFTLMHEHILVSNWSMRKAFPDWLDRDAFLEDAARQLIEVRERGVATLVDLTAINIGRDVEILREAAERSGMQIIAPTGFYWTEEPSLHNLPPDRLVALLVREIEEGIQGTDTRAGIIKCATDAPGVTDFNRMLLQVSARAHRATGVPISTHTAVGNRSGLAQQDVFEAEGVDLSRVVIGHCGDTDDLEYLEAILTRGSTIGMDRFGIDMILPKEKRVGTVAELCRRGWSGQMVLSHDAACRIDWFPAELIPAMAPNWNYRHVPDEILPALRKEGVSDEQIRTMTVENPRRILAAQGSY